MRSDTDLDPYEIAYLCGGPKRVAMVVLVALHEDKQIKISPARHRVEAVRRGPRDPIETAALETIPGPGKVLGPTVHAIAESTAVEEVGRTLHSDRLLPASRVGALWQWGRVRAIRRLHRRLIDDPATDGLTLVAAMGTSGITDPRLRRIFETPDPPPPVKVPKMSLGSPVDPLYDNNAPDRSGQLNSLLP